MVSDLPADHNRQDHDIHLLTESPDEQMPPRNGKAGVIPTTDGMARELGRVGLGILSSNFAEI
jgi:hypothetical protein